MSQENQMLLQEVYRAATMGEQAIRDVMPSVENPKLYAKIESQANAYRRIAGKSKRMLLAENAVPEESGLLQKMGLWGSIKMNTLKDNSTSHIAEMMIQGSNMGITEMNKQINAHPTADAGAKELGEEYIACEEKHVDSMTKFL